MVLTFKMDDVQDFWQSEKQRSILSLHIRNKIPIKIAVIAGIFGQDAYLMETIKEGISKGVVEVQNHGWDVMRIKNRSYLEQLQNISNANLRIQELLDVFPTEFVPHELAYDGNTVKTLDHLNMTLAIDEPQHVFVTDYINDEWTPFDLDSILKSIRVKVESYGYAEIYLHFQALSIEQYSLLFHTIIEEYRK